MTASPGRHPVVRAADGGDRAALRALLAASALPVADLDGAAIEFLVAADDDIVVGVVGLERFDDTALLRSLAVRADRRGSGLGDALVRAAEGLARAQGVTRLVLLTQTAAEFFGARGYAVIDRACAPAAVQQSAEFRSLCPASATCMVKPLVP